VVLCLRIANTEIIINIKTAVNIINHINALHIFSAKLLVSVLNFGCIQSNKSSAIFVRLVFDLSVS